jgi:hypothetical protein
MNKKLVVALTAPVFIFGCGQDKTADDILSQIHKKNTQKIVSLIEKHAKAIPTIFESENSLKISVQDVKKLDETIPFTTANIELSVKSGANESNFEKYKGFSNIELTGTVDGEEINGKLNGKASLKIVENSLFANLSEGKVESNQLPIAMVAPEAITKKSYEISFADLEKQINKAIPAEARGGKDIKVIDFIKSVSYAKAKEELKTITKIIQGGPIFKAITENPKAVAKLSADGKNYLIDVELNKERIASIANQYLDFIFDSIPFPAQENEVKKIKEQIKSGLADVNLKGLFTINKSNVAEFLYEGVLAGKDNSDVKILIDTRGDNLIISALSKENTGFKFSLIADKLEISIQDGPEVSQVVAEGTISKKAGNISFIDPSTKEVLTTISYKEIAKNKVTASIEIPSKEVNVSLEANLSQNMLSRGLSGSVEIKSVNIANFDIKTVIKKVSNIKVEKPIAEVIEKVDLEQAAMMLMMGGGAPMMMPEEDIPKEDIPKEDMPAMMPDKDFMNKEMLPADRTTEPVDMDEPVEEVVPAE